MSWHAPSLELIGCVHVGKEKACHGKCCRCGWENFHVKYPVFQVVITPNECFWGCASLHSFLLACDNACLHGSRLCLTMFSAQLAVSAGVLHCSGSTWPQLRWEVRVFYVFYSVLLQIWVKDKKKKVTHVLFMTVMHSDTRWVWMKNDFLEIRVVIIVLKNHVLSFTLCSSKLIVLNLDPVMSLQYQRLVIALLNTPVLPQISIDLKEIRRVLHLKIGKQKD